MTWAGRCGNGAPESMLPLARELLALNPDVIVAGATSGALAAYTVTRTIPIVMILPEDPVAAGYAQSTARPGGNVTGTWNLVDDTLVGKGLDFFKLAVPNLARVGVLFNPDDPTDGIQFPRLPVAARAIGVTIEGIEVRDLGNLDAVAARSHALMYKGCSWGFPPSSFPPGQKLQPWRLASSCQPCLAGASSRMRAARCPTDPNLPDLYRAAAS